MLQSELVLPLHPTHWDTNIQQTVIIPCALSAELNHHSPIKRSSWKWEILSGQCWDGAGSSVCGEQRCVGNKADRCWGPLAVTGAIGRINDTVSTWAACLIRLVCAIKR